MLVIGTVDEINDVVHHFSPRYPRQNLETIETNNCFYVLNGVGVEITVTDNYQETVKLKEQRKGSAVKWTQN